MKKEKHCGKIEIYIYSVVISTKNQKKLTVAQNATYNFIGSIVYSVCQWVISSLLVVHLPPEEMSLNNTGLLQLSMSVTNIFYALALYNVRTFQVSEVENKYSNADYVGARFITMGVSLLLCFGYSLSFGYEKKDILCIMFYMCYKLTEAFCDVLHGIDQKNYRMDYVGISYIARGIVSAIVFAVAILITSNIMIAIVAMALSGLIIAVLYDVPKASYFGSVKPLFDKKNLFSLLGECLPAVIASMAFIAIASIPRQILEVMYDKDTLGYYGTIAAPLVVVQVIATSIFNPMLTDLSHYYKNSEIRKFVMRLAKNLIMLVVIAAVICVGVALLGEFAVGLVFGQKFVPYTYLMYGIIGCTTMYVISWLCTSTLIIMRKLKVCAVASIVALGIAILLARPFINIFDMNGVSFSIIVAYITHAVVCSVVIIKVLMFKGKRKMSYTSSDHTYALCAYKESAYLEECVKSLLAQTVKSTIFIATSTPNDHIDAVAKKYDIPVFVNEGEKGIGGDWNFAYDKAQTPLVTIAHQDDIYEPTYTEKMLEYLNEANNPIIYFCGYGELRNDKKVYDNTNLTIKKILLSPLKIKEFWKSRFVRRRILSIGNSICCPAVTYVTERVGQKPFTNDYLSNIDWQQWELLSRKKGSFVYNNLPLMCHRIHDESTTTEIIGDSKRSKEDFDMFCKFWPRPVAKLIAKVYSGSEKSNNV